MRDPILENLTVSISDPDLFCIQSYVLLFEIILKNKVIMTSLDARLEVRSEFSSTQGGCGRLEICIQNARG